METLLNLIFFSQKPSLVLPSMHGDEIRFLYSLIKRNSRGKLDRFWVGIKRNSGLHYKYDSPSYDSRVLPKVINKLSHVITEQHPTTLPDPPRLHHLAGQGPRLRRQPWPLRPLPGQPGGIPPAGRDPLRQGQGRRHRRRELKLPRLRDLWH